MTATTSQNWRQKSTLPTPAPGQLHPLPTRPAAATPSVTTTTTQQDQKSFRRHSFSGVGDTVPGQAKPIGYATKANRTAQRVVALPKSEWNTVRVFGEDLKGNYRNGLSKSQKVGGTTRAGEKSNGVKDVGGSANGGTRVKEEVMVNVKLGNHSVAIAAHPSIPQSLVVDTQPSPTPYDVHHSFGAPVSPNPYYLNESLTPTLNTPSYVNLASLHLQPNVYYPTSSAEATPSLPPQQSYSDAPRHVRSSPSFLAPLPYHRDPNFSPSTASPSPPEFFAALANPHSMMYQQPTYHYGPTNGYGYPPGAMIPVPSSPYFSSPPTEWEYNSSSIPTQVDYAPQHPHTTTASSTNSNILSPYYSPHNPNWNPLDPNSAFYGPPLVEYLPDLYYPESFPAPPLPPSDQQAMCNVQNQMANDLGIQYAFSAAGANELGLELMGGTSNSARSFGEETASHGGERATIDYLRSGNVLRRTGTCKFFDIQKGFGFILDDRIEEFGGKDVFVHYTAIRQTAGFRCLSTGEAIEYDVVKATSGGFQALNVCGVDGRALKGLQPAQESLHARNAAGILAATRRNESSHRQANRLSSTSRPANRITAEASPDTTHEDSIIVDSSLYSSHSRPTSQQSGGANEIPLLLVKKTSSAVPILPPPSSRSISPASKVEERVEEAAKSESTAANTKERASKEVEKEDVTGEELERGVEGLKL